MPTSTKVETTRASALSSDQIGTHAFGELRIGEHVFRCQHEPAVAIATDERGELSVKLADLLSAPRPPGCGLLTG